MLMPTFPTKVPPPTCVSWPGKDPWNSFILSPSLGDGFSGQWRRGGLAVRGGGEVEKM